MNQHVGTLVAERPVVQPLQALLNDRDLQADLDKAEAASVAAMAELTEARAAENEAKHQARLARRRELYRQAQIQAYHHCNCTPYGRSLYYR